MFGCWKDSIQKRDLLLVPRLTGQYFNDIRINDRIDTKSKLTVTVT